MGSAKEVPSPSLQWTAARSSNSDAGLELRFDRAIEILLIALIAFVPWPFGSAHAAPEEIVTVAAGLLALCFAAKLLIAHQTRIVSSWIYLPIALFCALALAQLVPMPHSILRLISPSTLETKSRLLADLPDAAKHPMSLTFYARATRYNLRLLLDCATVFVVALNVLRTRRRLMRVLIAISVAGGLVSVLALAQDLTNAQKVYWTLDDPYGPPISGPYLGHNDFPLFANLSTGAALALLMVILAERRSSRSPRAPMSAERIAGICALIAVIGLNSCAVFLSLSRSGVLSLGAAAICIGIVAATRWSGGLERLMMAVCLLLCFAISFYLVSDSVNRRLDTLKHPLEEYIDRWQINKDIMAAWPRFPLFGTGIGTHEVVYPMFEHLWQTPNFDHAEDEFAQMLEETGAIGLGIILLFAGLVTAAFFRAVKRSARAPIGSAAVGLGLGLLAVTIQSGFGFGAHVISNAVLMAVECAMLLSILRLLQDTGARRTPGATRRSTGAERRPPLSVVLKWVGALIVLPAFALAIGDADRARRGEEEWEPAKRLLAKPSATGSFAFLADEQYQDVLTSAEMAHHAEPDNVKYFFTQIDFSWQAIERKHDPQTGENIRPNAEKAQVSRFVEQLNRIRVICPTYGPALLLAGQLKYLVLNQPAGLELIQLASTVAPTNPAVYLQIAAIDCERGDFGKAMDGFRQYLGLHGLLHGTFDAVVQLLVSDYDRPDLALQLAGNDPDRQLAIVSALRNSPQRPDYQTLAASIETKAKIGRRAELVEKCGREDASAEDLAALAEIYRSEHNLNGSIDCYQRALSKEYDQMDWHLNLAKALLAAGRASDAIEEASICLRRRPHMAAAEQLISDAEARTGTPDKP